MCRVEPALSEAKRRVVERLKRSGPLTAGELADELGLTTAAVRQHLAGLEDMGLVDAAPRPPNGPGRPATEWRLTERATTLFPDGHGTLAAGVLRTIEDRFGPEAVDAVIAARRDEQIAAYRAVVGDDPLADRVRTLARLRTEEGYLAEVVEDPGGWTLVEHHCPIAEAATCCGRLCGAELETFRAVLDARVERTEHLLAGSGRCAYRITPR